MCLCYFWTCNLDWEEKSNSQPPSKLNQVKMQVKQQENKTAQDRLALTRDATCALFYPSQMPEHSTCCLQIWDAFSSNRCSCFKSHNYISFVSTRSGRHHTMLMMSETFEWYLMVDHILSLLGFMRSLGPNYQLYIWAQNSRIWKHTSEIVYCIGFSIISMYLLCAYLALHREEIMMATTIPDIFVTHGEKSVTWRNLTRWQIFMWTNSPHSR